MDLTKSMIDCLQKTEWGMKTFGSIITNRQLPLRVMRMCIEAGLCKCNGLVYVCDDDGEIQYHRKQRLGYVLTEKGKKVLEQYTKKRYAANRCEEKSWT